MTTNLNQTPSANRTHIGIFGKRNAGKSSLINAITGQNYAIVSDVLGTTTDPVLKSMELLPLYEQEFCDRCSSCQNQSRKLDRCNAYEGAYNY